MNKKAHYDKAIISVEDHTHASKADLHRHDDLKHNQQRHRPEDPVARRWQQGSYTQLAHWTPPRPSEARAEHSVMVGHGSGSDGSREESGVHPAANGGGEVHHPDHVQRQQQLLQHQQRQQQHHHQPVHRGGGAEDRELRTQHRLDTPQSDGAAPPGGPTLEKDPAPPATTNQTEVTTQTATVTSNQTTGGGEREKSGSAHSGEPANRGIERDSKVAGRVRPFNGGGQETESSGDDTGAGAPDSSSSSSSSAETRADHI
ncbi:uncharacterized protein LOC117733799 [Cyclopterus lumpus]|uniref:uncharacterized protein LOC117733799 n=1 Tax=Cyclopterus lumpus TaxID=8103 RepID=UPI0014874C3E|nr:uncharacterized protein LOC117733799 [Cyclopterus lumpus]